MNSAFRSQRPSDGWLGPSAAMMGPEISIFLERFDAVYVEIPKVACTSLKVALARLLEVDLDVSGGNPHVVDFPSPPEASCVDRERLYPGLYAFAFVRNPWDRLVSCYRDKIRGEVDGFTRFTVRPGVADCLAGFEGFFANMSFEEFVSAVASIPDSDADEHFRSQSTFLMTAEGNIGVDFVGRYETLEDDFKRVCGRVGLLSSVRLPRLQAARHATNYVDYYTVRTKNVVADRFGQDIEAFAYRFGS